MVGILEKMTFVKENAGYQALMIYFNSINKFYSYLRKNTKALVRLLSGKSFRSIG